MSNTTNLFRESLKLDSVHDGRHTLQGKLGRESIPYLVNLPKHGIAFFTYTWVNKDSMAGAALAIFGPGVGDQPIQLGIADKPVPESMNFDNWQIDGLVMKQDLAFRKASVHWATDQAEVCFDYEAFHPPYAYGSNKLGCPPYIAENRIEQSGRAKGFLKINGKTISFDTTGHRDHSWGVRDWLQVQHYQWFQSQTLDNVSVHFWKLLAHGQTRLYGYVFKENLMAEVTDLELDMVYDDQLLHKSMNARIVDEAGRITQVSCQFYGHYPLIPDPGFVLVEGAGSAVIDGVEGPGHMEVAWPKPYLEHVRNSGTYE